MNWEVGFDPVFDLEFDALPTAVQDELLTQAKLLETFGPSLGRPRVDTLNGFRHANMKELRFQADNGVWRKEVTMTTLAERMDNLPTARRKKVEERANALIAEEMSLQDLRKARRQTQVRVAKELGINQENVSRIEKRSDLLISTLRSYVQAMGGKLSLVAEFPDRPPIVLTGIAALDKEAP